MLPSHRSKEVLDPVATAVVNIGGLIAASKSEILAVFWILLMELCSLRKKNRSTTP